MGASVEPFGILQKNSLVGLDFGSSSLKLVHLVKRESGLALAKADLREYSRPEDGAARSAETLSFLKEMLSGIDVRKTQFAVCINSDRTAMRVVTVPPMPPEELKEAVRLEAKNYFPFPVEDAVLDFEVLGETFEEGIKKLRVIVATTPKAAVDNVISLFKKAGLKPSALMPVPYAFYKLFQLSAKAKEDKTLCLVDVGYSCTECLLLKGNHLMFSRKIQVSGRDFTKALTGVLATEQGKTQLSWDEAERIKREVGIPHDAESKTINNKLSTVQMLSMLRAPLEQLAGEIDRSFGYYREENNGEDIQTLLLSGRGAALKGFPRFLSQELGVEAKAEIPLCDFKDFKTDAGMHFFAPAIGAATLAVGGGRTGINLLPLEIKEETKQTMKRAALKSAVAVIILTLIFIYAGLQLQLSNYKKRVEVAQLELSSLRFDLAKAEEKSTAMRLLAGEPYWEDVFMDLSNIVGGPITLTGWRKEEKRMIIRGTITAQEKEGFLSFFISNLERAVFNGVKLVTARETPDKSATEFELECWVD